jgi:uncharacterized membrane protein
MARLLSRVLLALVFLAAGTLHLFHPEFFMPIMPPWIPGPMACVIISGIAELAGGIGLLVPMREIQRAAGWGLLALLVAVFPANIYMATAHIRVNGFPSHDWISWARVPMQPLIMLWVCRVTGIWPATTGEGKQTAVA